MECCYICSPYRGNVFERIRNRKYARYLTAKAIRMGFAPITPHLYITQVLNDKIPEERKRGLEAGLKLLRQCKYIMVGGKYGISEGMKAENNTDRRQEIKNKENIDQVINAVAVIAIISFFIGAMVAIWVGFVGVKVLLSAVVLFIGDYATFFWISTTNKEKQRKENERGRRQA